MRINRANTLLLTVIGVATLLVAVIGATFAYFTATIETEEEGTTITVGAGKLTITYASEDGTMENIQKAEDIKPEVDEAALTKTFTITGENSTNSIMPYYIDLVITENQFLDNALTYTLSSTNTAGNGDIVEAIDATVIPEVQVGEPLTIPLGGGYFTGVIKDLTHTYVLNIFFQENYENQDINKDKEFGAYVNTRPGHATALSTTSAE